MATKKSAPKRGGKKVAEKELAISKEILQVNPPIVVGGGSSFYVWMRRELSPGEITPEEVPADVTKPKDPALYKIFKCNANILSAILLKGDGSLPVPLKKLHPAKHLIVLDVEE